MKLGSIMLGEIIQTNYSTYTSSLNSQILERESRMVVQGDMGGLVFKEYTASVWVDKKVLEMTSGDGYTAL